MFDACIDMDGGDEAFCELIYERRTAEAEVQCCECGVIISKEREYEHARGYFCTEDTDGFEVRDETSLVEYHTCLVCVGVLRDFTNGNFRMFGELWKYMADAHDIDSPTCIPEWTDEDEEDWLERHGGNRLHEEEKA